ncbi:matrix [Matariya virus]|uniref:Matrix n=1 Tax=Matariya virus TaxID=1272948 RepID=A0AAE8XCK9_9RHAB|nr:matrix [Matariya virus]UAU42906.1 matrix [Matariya virus]WAD86865.1 matrix [Matariya virus]
MNRIRKFLGYGDENFDFFVGTESKMITSVETKVYFTLNVTITRVGTSALSKEIILKEILQSYRGPSEKESLFIIGALLSVPSWIRKKDGTGYGFRGEYGVKFDTDNLSLMSDFEHESVSTYVKDNWIVLINSSVKTKKSKGGFNPSSKVQEVITKFEIKTNLFEFSPLFIVH